MRTRAILRTAPLVAGVSYEVRPVEVDDLRPGDMVHCRCLGMLQMARFVRHVWLAGRRHLVVVPEGARTETPVAVSDLRGILIIARGRMEAPRSRRPCLRRVLGWVWRRTY